MKSKSCLVFGMLVQSKSCLVYGILVLSKPVLCLECKCSKYLSCVWNVSAV